MESKKVIHLHFKEPQGDQQDFYFGSLRAIYSLFASDEIGIAYASLVAKHRGRYENKKCIITQGTIIRNKRHN